MQHPLHRGHHITVIRVVTRGEVLAANKFSIHHTWSNAIPLIARMVVLVIIIIRIMVLPMYHLCRHDDIRIRHHPRTCRRTRIGAHHRCHRSTLRNHDDTTKDPIHRRDGRMKEDRRLLRIIILTLAKDHQMSRPIRIILLIRMGFLLRQWSMVHRRTMEDIHLHGHLRPIRMCNNQAWSPKLFYAKSFLGSTIPRYVSACSIMALWAPLFRSHACTCLPFALFFSWNVF